MSTLLFSTHLFLAGLLVIGFLPRTRVSILDTLTHHPGRSVLADIVLLLSVPIAAFFLIVSGITTVWLDAGGAVRIATFRR